MRGSKGLALQANEKGECCNVTLKTSSPVAPHGCRTPSPPLTPPAGFWIAPGIYHVVCKSLHDVVRFCLSCDRKSYCRRSIHWRRYVPWRLCHWSNFGYVSHQEKIVGGKDLFEVHQKIHHLNGQQLLHLVDTWNRHQTTKLNPGITTIDKLIDGDLTLNGGLHGMKQKLGWK